MASARLGDKKTLELLNTQLRELDQIVSDLNRAKDAGVPGIDQLLQSCSDCRQRAEKFKQVYYSEQI